MEMTKNKVGKTQTLKIPKIITVTAKLLEIVSPHLATLFAAKLFTTPIKHKIPKREIPMDKQTKQSTLFVPDINKEIIVYHYGQSNKKILLIHGWSGRGTQLFKIADTLLHSSYQTISFDAPAHGKSKGHSTIMIEFIACIHELDKQFGPFEVAIGHSLGGMALINALKENLQIKKAVTIGSGDIIQDIVEEFIHKLGLPPQQAIRLRDHFEKKYQLPMDSLTTSREANKINTPVLIIHDQQDQEVNIKAAHAIHNTIPNSQLIITHGQGHRKILGSPEVITKISNFINN